MPYDARAMPQAAGSGHVEAPRDEGPRWTISRGSLSSARRSSTRAITPAPCAMRSRPRSRPAGTRPSCRSTCTCSQGGGALATLIKLFLLDLEVSGRRRGGSAARPPLDRMEAMGVLERRDGAVKALIEIVPTEDLLIACDAFQKELARPDHVLGVSPPARVLAWLTVREPVERALDLGTGQRPPGASRRAPRRPRHGGRHQPARAPVRRVQRDAERSARSTSARGTCSSRSPARRST